MAGRLAGRFEYNRSHLLETVVASVQMTLEQHDQRAEAVRIAGSVQGAVANAALLEVGAVGPGAIVSLLATSTAVDVTGILAAVGFFVLPRSRRQAKRELSDRIGELRKQLSGALTTQFDTETVASVRRIEDAIAPYVQFVEGQRGRLQARAGEIATIDGRLIELQSELGGHP